MAVLTGVVVEIGWAMGMISSGNDALSVGESAEDTVATLVTGPEKVADALIGTLMGGNGTLEKLMGRVPV